MAGSLHYICPTCGSDVEVGQACPGCPKPAVKRRPKQKQAAHSWQQDEAYDGLDLPDEDLDDGELTAREYEKVPHRALGVRWYWWALGVVLLVLMLLGLATVLPFWF